MHIYISEHIHGTKSIDARREEGGTNAVDVVTYVGIKVWKLLEAIFFEYYILYTLYFLIARVAVCWRYGICI